MPRRELNPGFRFSTFDALVILAGAGGSSESRLKNQNDIDHFRYALRGATIRTAILSFLIVLFSSFRANGEDLPEWKPTLTIQRINDPKQVDGYWALGAEWTGYMGLALELRDGKFRYWFMSDVDSPESKRKFPIIGKFTVEHGFLELQTKQRVYDTRWLLISHEGRTGLFPISDFETITMRREAPHTRMLFHVPEAAAKAKWPLYNEP